MNCICILICILTLFYFNEIANYLNYVVIVK